MTKVLRIKYSCHICAKLQPGGSNVYNQIQQEKFRPAPTTITETFSFREQAVCSGCQGTWAPWNSRANVIPKVTPKGTIMEAKIVSSRNRPQVVSKHRLLKVETYQASPIT